MNYSQDQEEKYILEATRGAPNKRFCDIGAFHATDKSNTRALYEAGWSGVMIEPSPGPMLQLLDTYGNDEQIKLVLAAVGLEAGWADLHVTDDAVSTLKREEYERWKDHAKFRGVLLVPVLTLETISLRFGGFDFISLDTEGTSPDLFLHAMELEWKPQCWCVEHNERTTEILAAATAAGYRCTYGNGTNLVLSL